MICLLFQLSLLQILTPSQRQIRDNHRTPLEACLLTDECPFKSGDYSSSLSISQVPNWFLSFQSCTRSYSEPKAKLSQDHRVFQVGKGFRGSSNPTCSSKQHQSWDEIRILRPFHKFITSLLLHLSTQLVIFLKNLIKQEPYSISPCWLTLLTLIPLILY